MKNMADGRRRQDEVGGDVEHVGEPGIVRADRFVAEARQPIHRDRKQQDRHQRHPEQRGGIEDQRQHRDRGVGPGTGKARGQRAEQDTEHERDRERGSGQQQRRRQALQDQGCDRHLLAKREAEIEAEDAFDIEKQLHRQRLVETELLAQLRQEDLIARAGFARHHQGRVARRHPDQKEVEDDEREKDDDGLRDPLGDERNHGLSIALENGGRQT